MNALDKLREILPWKRKGYKVLDRFDTSAQRDGDLRVIAQMLEHGADLAKERHVVHYLYFPDDSSRASAEQELNAKEYHTRHGVDYGQQRPKSLIAERHGLVNEALVDDERELLTRVAETYRGEYDGWEAALD